MSSLTGQRRRVLMFLVLALVALTGIFFYEPLLGLQISGLTAPVFYLVADRGNRIWTRNWQDKLLVCLALGLFFALVFESRRLENTFGGDTLLFRCLLAGVCLGLVTDFLLARKRSPAANSGHRYRYTFPIILIAALLVAATGSRMNRYLSDSATTVESYQVIAKRRVFSQGSSGQRGGDTIPINYVIAYVRVGDTEEGLNVGSEEVRVGDTLTVTTRRGFFGFRVVDEIQIHHRKGP